MEGSKCAQEELLHTIDVCPESEVGIVGQRLGDIRVGARDISILLSIVSDKSPEYCAGVSHTYYRTMEPVEDFLRDSPHILNLGLLDAFDIRRITVSRNSALRLSDA